MSITRESALQILNSRTVAPAAGKYTVKATNVVPYIRPDGTQVSIVNFNIMTPYHASEATKAFKEGDYEKSVANTTMTASQLSGMYVPVKGEIVDIEVSDYTTKDGHETLVVSSIVPRKAVKAVAFSLVEEAVAEEEI